MFFSYWRGDFVYSQLTTDEIAKLSINKASGAAWGVYSALSAHAWTKATVFPSIQRISDVLANAYSHRAIYKALSFLEKIGLIVRKAATVKERFTLVLKQVAKKAKAAALKTTDMNNRSQYRTNGQHKKRTRKERMINHSNTEHKKIIANHFPGECRHPGDDWLEAAYLYLEGISKERPPKIDRQTAIKALNNNNAVADLIKEGGKLDDALLLL